VLPVAERTSSGKLRRAIGAKDVRLAPADDVYEVMGCKPGTCHPIGKMIGLRTIVDKSLEENEIIGIATGDTEHTIVLSYSEYARVAMPEIVDIRSEK
jgi:prolyl-tRNA editing enzyme YbaK/EbsC (Cys-tRNA(Pro) deacylase)